MVTRERELAGHPQLPSVAQLPQHRPNPTDVDAQPLGDPPRGEAFLPGGTHDLDTGLAIDG